MTFPRSPTGRGWVRVNGPGEFPEMCRGPRSHGDLFQVGCVGAGAILAVLTTRVQAGPGVDSGWVAAAAGVVGGGLITVIGVGFVTMARAVAVTAATLSPRLIVFGDSSPVWHMVRVVVGTIAYAVTAAFAAVAFRSGETASALVPAVGCC